MLVELAVAAFVSWASPAPAPVAVVVDGDDDDRSGLADLADKKPRSLQVAPLPLVSGEVRGPSFARLVVDGEARGATAALARAPRSLGLQALEPGRGTLVAGGVTREVRAVAVRALDASGSEVDLARSHASFERSLPARASAGPSGEEALTFVVVGASDDLPRRLVVRSLDERASRLGRDLEVALTRGTCPAALRSLGAAGHTCASTPAVRVVLDELDRAHPLVSARSVVGALGGALELRGEVAGTALVLARVRVGGPRESPVGPIDRLRLRLRVTAVGSGTDAAELARLELRRAGRLWAQCGVALDERALVRSVAPPGPHLLAVGCGLGLRASGGKVALRANGKEVRATVAKGATPAEAARAIATAIEASGAAVVVTPLARIGSAAFPGVDLSVRTRSGALGTLEALAGGALTDDATLGLCIGSVDLSDGLSHFGDVDSIAGTLEERALLEAIDDGDPTTAELVLLPGFAGGSRIGESFIGADGGALRGFVLVDRGGIRAEGLTSTLAHELGHVLLEEPGHPDDFGQDTPTRLMDADAASGTLFGPRRLTAAECARAVREHGPDSSVPMLERSPFAALPMQSDRAP